jgi:hypothetical protein
MRDDLNIVQSKKAFIDSIFSSDQYRRLEKIKSNAADY